MAVSTPNDGPVEKALTKRDAACPDSAKLRPSTISRGVSGRATSSTTRACSSQNLPESMTRVNKFEEEPVYSVIAASSASGEGFLSAKVGSFPELPVTASGVGFYFDPRSCSSFMDVASPKCLRCHTNATRSLQGVCFLSPPVLRGECSQIKIRLDNKPGRMRYFLGIARQRFGDASDITLRKAGWSIENLYARPHSENSPCNTKAPPLFHTGSTVTLMVDLRESSTYEISFTVDTSGVEFREKLPKNLDKVEFWVSLYNRFAQFSILDT